MRKTSWYLPACLVIVAAADVLFYRHVLGWTVGAFAVLLLLLALARGGGPHSRMGWMLTLGTLGLGVAGALSVNWRVGVLSAAGLMSLVMIRRQGRGGRVSRWVLRAVEFGVQTPFKPLRDLWITCKFAQRRGGHPLSVFRGVLTWGIPLVLTGFFLLLFNQANPIINKYVRWVWDNLYDWLKDLIAIDRWFLWAVVALGVWALLRLRTISPARPRRTIVIPMPVIQDKLALTVIVHCLVLFNVLFAVQTIMDLVYLGAGMALPAGMTYAQYAHRGAYPLVVAALLAGLFVFVTFSPSSPADKSPLARRLVYLWIAQNILLTFTAAWRLDLYVDAYSLSRWRVAAAFWLVLVALGLVWIVVRLARRLPNEWLIRANALTLTAMLYAAAFVDFDFAIAWYNVRHCREINGTSVPIDLDYLHKLGPHAIPAVAWLSEHVDDHVLQPQLRSVQAQLQDDLRKKLKDWRGWTYLRWRINRDYPPITPPDPMRLQPQQRPERRLDPTDPEARSRLLDK
ncbi:MAG: DUF4173 domain-containing protein [Phycisphaeraceae bacterium]|nr:DUF4173 domain-containing protein [Phycisphaeraceae bacterium]